MMSDIRSFVFEILKAAIWKMPVRGQEGFGMKEWSKVYSVLGMHGLAAFAYDAVAALPADMKPPKEVAMKFISSALAAEKNYAKFAGIDREIGEMVRESGCKAIRLKGLTLSEYYPKPYTRKFVDIDFYSPDNGNEIDSFFRSKGVAVDDGFYRHSHFHLHGVLVENHKCLLDVRGRRKMRELDKDLKAMAVERLEAEAAPGMYDPPVRISAIFNLHHALSHFIYEGISLKFLTDWIYFLRAEKEVMGSDEMKRSLERHGLTKFAGVMTKVSVKYLAYPEEWLPAYLREAASQIKPSVERKFMDDLFRSYEPSHHKSIVKERMNNVRRIMKASWKPSEFLGQSAVSFVAEKFIPILLGRRYEAD